MDIVADLVIRGGTILDGTGGAPFIGDIAIMNGKIIGVGTVSCRGREEIEADGKIVTPGFIDVHTHYDGQLIWSDQVSPSSGHGVTTVVTGNCGVGFAPCRERDRMRLIKLLEGVEDMPEIVLADGLTWDWESFPDYVEALKRRRHDIDFAVQLPHAALRVFVMGERAADGAVATAQDLAEMRKLARGAIEAGALGFGTSRSIFHTTRDGVVIPTAHAEEAELKAIADGMLDAGGGTIQAILNIEFPQDDFRMLRRVAEYSGLPMSFSLFQDSFNKESWREMLDMTTAANANGTRVTAQVLARPVGVLLGLDVSFNPFSAYPSYMRISGLPLAERVREMRKPETRAAILGDRPEKRDMVFFSAARRYQAIYPLGRQPNYEPDASSSIAAQAAARGMTPEEVAYDLLLEDDGHTLLLLAAANYENQTLDEVREMLMHPNAVPALGDGGAHYGMICDSTYTTFMLTHWGRDRNGERIPLPQIIQLMSARPAEMLGLADRGRIAVGLKADINVIDFDRLTLQAPRVVQDLPSGGRRLTQDAGGYDLTVVSGDIIMRNGIPTGALPGRMAERSSLYRAPLAAE